MAAVGKAEVAMRWLGLALVAVGVGAFIGGTRLMGLSSGFDPGQLSAPTPFGVGNMLQTAGLCTVVIVVLMTVWVAPALWALRRLRSARPEALVWLSHRSPNLTVELGRLFGEEPNVPYFTVAAVDGYGIEIVRATGRVTRIPWARVCGVKSIDVRTTRMVPAIRVEVEAANGATANLDLIVAKNHWEIFPDLDKAHVDLIREELEQRSRASEG